jgi:lipoprotein-releasing system permease protein
MNTKLLAGIGLSLLLARWKQTLVAAVGVTFSIMMFVALLGFMTGLNEMLDGLVLNRTPHIRLYNEIKPTAQQPLRLSPQYRNAYHFIHSIKAAGSREQLHNSTAIRHALQQDPRVTGIAPKVTASVFFNDGNVDINGMIQGIDVEAENRLFHFGDYVVAGSYRFIGQVPNSIILGKALAQTLLVQPGEVIQVTTIEGDRFPLKVVGLFQSGLQEFDKSQSYVALPTVQKLLGKTTDYITDLQLTIRDMKQAPGIAREMAAEYGADAVDIQAANADFDTGSFIRSLISYVVGVTMLIVAGFGIYNILNMMIYEKMDAIAILKATGFSGRDVKTIFLLIALGIGVAGGLVGLLLGFILSLLIDQVPFISTSLPTVTTYPVSYAPGLYIIGGVFSLVTTWFSGWLPARKASKVDPVIIIRGK